MIASYLRLGLVGLFLGFIITATPAARAVDIEVLPSLSIELPPFGLTTLFKEVRFGATTCTFGTDGPGTTPLSCPLGTPYTFTKTKIVDDVPDEGSDDRYVIKISGFPKGNGLSLNSSPGWLAKLNEKIQTLTTAAAFAPPPATSLCIIAKTVCAPGSKPYGFQVTFVGSTISSQTISDYNAFLSNKALTYSFLGNNICATGSNPSRICLKTLLKLRATEQVEAERPDLVNTLVESVLINQGGGGNILFEGNVGGSGILNGFGFTDTKAIAVGGNVDGVQGTNKLPGYFTNPTKLSWGNIAAQLTNLFNKRSFGTDFGPSGTFGGGSASPPWNLNSNTSSPINPTVSSFSSPPEGKLWNVKQSLTFKNSVAFNGRGTIAVNGDVTFNGNVSCTDGSQVGIIASGSITFNGGVGCGTYTALGTTVGGNITFTRSIVGDTPYKGIFVAKNNIDLPTVTGGTLTIHYDTDFANDPTVLFKELLGIIFGTDS